MLQEIDLDLLVIPDDNVRDKATDLDELARSIAAEGILSPLNVTPLPDGRFLVVAGTRRTLAARKVAADPVKFPGRIIAAVPAVVEERSDTDRVVAMLIENLQRVDITPLEEARGYFRLVSDGALTQQDIAARIGRSKAHVSKRLLLLALPESAQKLLGAGKLTIEGALQLAKLAEAPDEIERLVKKYWGGEGSHYDYEELEDDGTLPEWAVADALRRLDWHRSWQKVADKVTNKFPHLVVTMEVNDDVDPPEGHELVWFEEIAAAEWDGKLGDDDISAVEITQVGQSFWLNFYGVLPVGTEGVEDLIVRDNKVVSHAESVAMTEDQAKRRTADERRQAEHKQHYRILSALGRREAEHARAFQAGLAAKPSTTLLKDLLRWYFLHHEINQSNHTDICKILELEVPTVEEPVKAWDNVHGGYKATGKTKNVKQPGQAIRDFAAKSEANMQRVIAAVTLFALEHGWAEGSKDLRDKIREENGYVEFDKKAVEAELKAKIKK